MPSKIKIFHYLKLNHKNLDSISIMDKIVATQKDDLLGNWIGLANDRATNYDDFSKDAFEFNAKH